MLRAIRGANWDHNEDIEHFIKCKVVGKNGRNELDERNVEVFARAIGLLQRELNDFPTSLEQDLRMMQEEQPLRKYFAILYRSQVKEIITDQIQLLEEICAIREVSDHFRIQVHSYLNS